MTFKMKKNNLSKPTSDQLREPAENLPLRRQYKIHTTNLVLTSWPPVDGGMVADDLHDREPGACATSKLFEPGGTGGLGRFEPL